MIQQGRPFSFVSKFIHRSIDRTVAGKTDSFRQLQLAGWSIPDRPAGCQLDTNGDVYYRTTFYIV